VVGRTGAGKSTLCLSLCRILEAEAGKIVIGGRDIATVPLPILRKNITIIPQDPTLFEGTLRFNVDPFLEKDEAEIIDLMKKASLDSLLQRDEKGLNMEIQANGGNLSAGEKQLICLCRAILKVSVMSDSRGTRSY
jgi:ABC-type multidrug transport system fused ATPase/permease subunit